MRSVLHAHTLGAGTRPTHSRAPTQTSPAANVLFRLSRPTVAGDSTANVGSPAPHVPVTWQVLLQGDHNYPVIDSAHGAGSEPGEHEAQIRNVVHESFEHSENERQCMQADARNSALRAWAAMEDLWDQWIKADEKLQDKYRARVRGIHHTVMPPDCSEEEFSLHQKAMTLAQQSKRDSALELLHEGMAKFPRNPVFATSAASIYIRLELYRRAHTCLEQAIKLEDNNSVVLQVLGRLCGKVNRPDLARKLFKRSIQVYTVFLTYCTVK
jgi:tetratricopeptide (TPR) repeat protein